MERRQLGGTGLRIPVVGMGTWKTFDVEGAQRSARKRLTREALDLDVRLFDTSPMYGAAEEVLAHALTGHRGEAFVATKVWATTVEEGLRQVAHSVALYEGRVDVLQVHNLRLWREHLPELERRKAAGQVAATGVTHYSVGAFPELEEAMRTGAFDMVQVPYHLLGREVEKRILPLAEKLGIGVLVMEPLGTGALPRKAPPEETWTPFTGGAIRTWAQVCLKWILSDTRVTAILPATSQSAHLHENAAVGAGDWYDAKERAAIVDLVA